MKAHNTFKLAARGFSLIEVLVAVVILSVGLLALASLQLNMIRASSTTKAQSIAAGLAKDKIESIRSYSSLAGYWAITAPAAGFVDNFTDSGGDLGGNNYTRTTKVTRYVYNKATPAFVALTNAQNTLTDAGVQALSANYVIGKDFKRITVDVSWTDGNGTTNTASMEDLVDSLDPTESGDILSATSSTSGPRKVEKKISDPALDAMVIPIAVGGGSESAASNPKPTVTLNSGADTVETRFDVLTYNGVNAGTANVQARVETAMVGCTCTFDSPPASTVRGMRPTYWNGFRYAVPFFVDSTGSASYSPKGKVDPTVTGQSTFCGICCRDHMDPVNVKGPTFSPRLVTKNASDVVTASSHDHYLASGNPSTWTGPLSSGKYSEACRIIRVDGIWSVAADIENDYFNLLATQELSDPKYYASGSAPDATATTNYQAFVVGYLEARYVNSGTSQANYNTLLGSTPIATLESANNLNAPAQVPINNTFIGGTPVAKTISGITRANPGVVTTSTAHTFANDDRVTFLGVGGMTQLNGKSYIIANVTSTTFQIKGLDTSTFTAFSSGGTATVNHAKWLHSRGMFADYLEKDALAAIDAAKTACPSQSGSAYTNCVLQVLPFTSINLTELANWTTADSTKVLVTNNDRYIDSSLPANFDPIRGKVTFKTGAVDGSVANINTVTRKANTSLLDLASPSISSADNSTFTDAQPFVIGNSVVGPSDTTGMFYVGLNVAKGTGWAVNYIVNAGASTTCNYDVPTANFICDVNGVDKSTWSNIANTVAIEFGGYNFETPGAVVTAATTAPGACTYGGVETGFPTKTYTKGTSLPLNTTYTSKTCSDYNITGSNSTLLEASGTPIVTNNGKLNESTRIPLVHVNADPVENDTNYIDKISVVLTGPSAPTTAPVICKYTCTAFDNNGHPGDCKTAANTTFTFTPTCL
jgi:type IV pilus modification protein PilV